ncbi:helix-turn-helix domain-containing protein [Sediminicola sp. 1XM1-17]|uniref:helix-turn-helix domain-containing protein n=1 Tax=Sediminicola sp. 1XM1-17 TaxID=3127702 RepID=UPI003076B047
MLNQDAFLKRLDAIMQYYDVSASAMADKIGVQRSSISHLLTGRNKPSLEFVMKVVDAFPEVNLYWLLQGDGEFPTRKKETATLFTTPEEPMSKETASPPEAKNPKVLEAYVKQVERIVIFYTDGSFQSYSEIKD